jgi:hypothetical protein
MWGPKTARHPFQFVAVRVLARFDEPIQTCAREMDVHVTAIQEVRPAKQVFYESFELFDALAVVRKTDEIRIYNNVWECWHLYDFLV